MRVGGGDEGRGKIEGDREFADKCYRLYRGGGLFQQLEKRKEKKGVKERRRWVRGHISKNIKDGPPRGEFLFSTIAKSSKVYI